MNKEKEIMEYRQGIRTDRILKNDPMFLEKAEAKLQALEDLRDYKKMENRRRRMKGEEPKYKVKTISDLTSRICKLKDRIIERTQTMKMTEKDFDGSLGRVIYNKEFCRIQLYTEKELPVEVRQDLRENNFIWSEANKCWQAFLKVENIEKIKKLQKKYEDKL